MTCEVHRIVKNPNDFNDAAGHGAIHDEVTSAAAVTRHVERAKVRQYFVSRGASRCIRPVAKRCDGSEQSRSIEKRLLRAEGFPRVSEDERKIAFCVDAEADFPLRLYQLFSGPEMIRSAILSR